MSDSAEADPLPPGRGRLVLAAVTGFAIGSGVLGMLWAASGSPGGPADDARAACAALWRAGELPEQHAGRSLPPAVLRRVLAARELSRAAAELNPDYADLAEHIDGVSRMVVSLHLADPAGRWHLAEARADCNTV
ncbi:hypothetical protein [Amycolatopsis cihanbeyliensis]|uniref:Uncharacterized protein n=1 Tax=Amycolatopsis cihanbeyliensis TaxID=1128664 RepID=A0A542DMB5_AMYCI|nr:hypothetical protein [Amycolatopsis cihanbeyliensis]TQJ04125.1 hypothetical protein FB471_3906 [Amycolatopsis cihanbeyliensis]